MHSQNRCLHQRQLYYNIILTRDGCIQCTLKKLTICSSRTFIIHQWGLGRTFWYETFCEHCQPDVFCKDKFPFIYSRVKLSGDEPMKKMVYFHWTSSRVINKTSDRYGFIFGNLNERCSLLSGLYAPSTTHLQEKPFSPVVTRGECFCIPKCSTSIMTWSRYII